MRILGVDPSLTSTGLVLVEGGQVIDTTRVRSKKKGPERVEDILGCIEAQIWGGPRVHQGHEYSICEEEDAPDIIVGIEGTAMHAKGSSIVQIFGLWGIITHQLWRWGVPFYVVTPTARAKYGSGKGNASKDEVLASVIRRYLDVKVEGNDVADALVIAAMGARHYGQPIEDAPLPEAHRSALDKVVWPV